MLAAHIDFFPTLAAIAGAKVPAAVAQSQIEGRSLVPAFADKPIEREAIYWEHEGNAAVRQGDLKLVRQGRNGAWELYDLKTDRTELHDLAPSQPAKAFAGVRR